MNLVLEMKQLLDGIFTKQLAFDYEILVQISFQDQKRRYDEETRKFCALHEKHYQLKNKTKEDLLKEVLDFLKGSLKLRLQIISSFFFSKSWSSKCAHNWLASCFCPLPSEI